MRKLVTALAVIATVYLLFNLTVGNLITGKVNELGGRISNLSGAQLAGSIPVDSSVCSLLVERGNWRGMLESISFPIASRASDRLLTRYSFQIDSRRSGQTHCVKYNNSLFAKART